MEYPIKYSLYDYSLFIPERKQNLINKYKADRKFRKYWNRQIWIHRNDRENLYNILVNDERPAKDSSNCFERVNLIEGKLVEGSYRIIKEENINEV